MTILSVVQILLAAGCVTLDAGANTAKLGIKRVPAITRRSEGFLRLRKCWGSISQ